VLKFPVLFIGCGNMGSSIIDGILSNQVMKKSDLFIIEPNLKKRRSLNKKGLSVYSSISELEIKKLGIKALLIAVKPQIVKEVAYEIKDYINTSHTIISIVAGKKIKFYKNIFGKKFL
jgi:pyrroline-5-carboxylate reductase